MRKVLTPLLCDLCQYSYMILQLKMRVHKMTGEKLKCPTKYPVSSVKMSNELLKVLMKPDYTSCD